MASKQFLEKAYLAYFGRPVDPTGLRDFQNSTEAEVEAAFSASPESKALYGDTFGPIQINAIYNVLFGRDAEPAGVAYWVHQVELGLLTPAGAALGIMAGAQNSDVTAVENKLAASALFTSALDTPAEMQGYSGAAAAAVARDFLGHVNAMPATDAQVTAAVAYSTGVASIVLTADASVNEGNTVIFHLDTINAAPGSVYAYTLSGVNAADVVGGQLTGSVTLDSLGKAVVAVNLVADHLTEGAETLTLSVAGQSAAVTVNDTSLTPPQVLTTSVSDVINAQPTDDVILGQVTDTSQPTAANTLNASDVIHGGAGADKLLITADGGSPIVSGFTMDGVETLEVRSYTTEAGVTLGLINVTDLETVKSTNSTGNIALTEVQNLVTLDLSGVGGDSINVDVVYSPDAVIGSSDRQAINLNRFVGEILVGDASRNGIESVDITTAGGASDIYLGSNALANITVGGDADLTLAAYDSDLTSVSADGFTHNLTLSASLTTDSTVSTGSGNDILDLDVYGAVSGVARSLLGGTTSVNAGEGKNEVTITEHEGDAHVGTINVIAGAGADIIHVVGLEGGRTSVVVDAGAGSNNIEVGVASNWTGNFSGGSDSAHFADSVTVTTLGGDDTIAIAQTNTVIVNAGDGANDVMIGDVTDDAEIIGGAGVDSVTTGDVGGLLTATLGAGNNILNTTAGSVNDATVTTLGGNDSVHMGLVVNSITADLGDGDNTFVLDSVAFGTPGTVVSVTTGSGVDMIDLSGTGDFYGEAGDIGTLTVNTGAGDDTVKLGSNGLQVWDYQGETGYVAAGYSINGGEGNNTLVAKHLQHNIDAVNSFANVHNFQTLQITRDVSGSLDGVLTGANATGIVNYILDGQIDDDLALINVNNNVNVVVNDGTDNYDLTLSVDSAISTGTAATLTHNAAYSGSSDWFDRVRFDNIETLTVNANTADSVANSSTLGLGDSSVFADQLKTLNINGDETVQIYADSDSFGSLTTVNAGTMTGDLTLDLDGVTHAATGVTITTGSGSDDITTGYGKITIDAGEGNNLIHADSGGGDVIVTAGNGDNDVTVWAGDDKTITVTLGNGDNSVEGDESIHTTVTAGNGSNQVDVGGGGVGTLDTVTLGDNSIVDGVSNGNNSVLSYSANSVITTGSGRDFIRLYNSGFSEVHAGAGDDSIRMDAIELTAADILDGGAGDDTLTLVGSLGTQDDAFFRQWNSVENLVLDGNANNLTLGFIANNDAGLKSITLSSSGSGDTLNLTTDFTGPLSVTLGNGADTINVAATGGPSRLDVYALASQLDASGSGDALHGGNGASDTLHIVADSGGADLSALRGGFENVVVDNTDNLGFLTVLYTSGVVNNNEALKVDASGVDNASIFALVDTFGGDNSYDVTGGKGANYIDLHKNGGASNTIDLTGSTLMGADNGQSYTFVDPVSSAPITSVSFHNFVSTSALSETNTIKLADGNNLVGTLGSVSNSVTGGNGTTAIRIGSAGSTDSVTLGNGDNYVQSVGGSLSKLTATVGNGSNSILGGAGDDVITAGNGTNHINGAAGDDVITVGNGMNFINGGAGADTINLGTGTRTGGNTVIYGANSDSSGLAVDTITGFHGGTGLYHDVIDLSAVVAASGGGSVVFLGNVANATIANTALLDITVGGFSGTNLQVIYVTGEHTLYADYNDNGVIDTGDMAINLVGLAGTLSQANFATVIS